MNPKGFNFYNIESKVISPATMLPKQIYTEKTVLLGALFPNFSHEFLKPFKGIINGRIKQDLHLDFHIAERKNQHKISPILRLARPEDAKELVEIYKELYDGTYPYKEMEDVNEVRKMIKDPAIEWIIYQDPSYNIAGCVTFVLDFKNKRGYIRGFMLKEKYQGYIDITKAMIGSMISMLHKYKDVIYTWYVENRTAHAKSQYSMYVCGIAPIGFYPNKDVFCGKVESDLMQILYDKRVLNELRSKEIPQLIPQVESCFNYSNRRYRIRTVNVEVPEFCLNKLKVRRLRKSLNKKIIKDKFGYEIITLSFTNSDSFFQFLYTPQVQNFEKTAYKVTCLEELYLFVQEFLKCKKELGVRYCEVFISAYKCEHQQIFYNAGFKPRGYIPSWRFSPKQSAFKDSVLFSLYEGAVSSDIQLIDEGFELVQTLGIAQFSKFNDNIEFVASEISEKKGIERFVRHSLLTSMIIYLSLLLICLLVAMNLGTQGFDLSRHTISDLGNSLLTPTPSLFDVACEIAGTITIPYSFYIYSMMTRKRKLKDPITTRLGFLFGIFGGLGYICVGVFSLERAGPNGMIHSISAIIAFTGFVFSILFFSIPVVFQSGIRHRLFGLSGIVSPLLLFIINGFISTPILEWLLLLSILIHIVPLNYRSVIK
ncbi:MAG: DUF998 domain-containing protein [Candidatus Thorarchaeota archaeon]